MTTLLLENPTPANPNLEKEVKDVETARSTIRNQENRLNRLNSNRKFLQSAKRTFLFTPNQERLIKDANDKRNSSSEAIVAANKKIEEHLNSENMSKLKALLKALLKS